MNVQTHAPPPPTDPPHTLAVHCFTLPCRCHKLPSPYAQGRSPPASALMLISSSCHEGHCLLLPSLHQQTWTTSSASVGNFCQEDLCQPFSLVQHCRIPSCRLSHHTLEGLLSLVSCSLKLRYLHFFLAGCYLLSCCCQATDHAYSQTEVVK